MIEIDGAQGEGGGQVLRTALSLSMVTGSPFRMFNIRAHRRKPGLRQQHLTAVSAAQAVSSADVDGAELGAAELAFVPGGLRAGEYAFDVGTAGSTTLIAQTLVSALMLATESSHITLTGGTHNPMAPPFEFLDRSYLPLLGRMGARVRARLVRPGYFPAGGGILELAITPALRLSTLDLTRRGDLLGKEAHATVCHLPLSIAHRELAKIRHALGWTEEETHAHDEPHGTGPGNVVIVLLVFEQLSAVFAGFGQRGVSAETVADGVVERVSDYLASDVGVEQHLADQLLVPMALAGGGRFTTLRPTSHTETNMRIIQAFLPVRFTVEHMTPESWRIAVRRDD